MLALMSAAFVSEASAQTTLEWIVLSNQAGSGNGTLTLTSIPPGYKLVLTDLEWSPNQTTSGPQITLTISSSGGGCASGTQARWYTAGALSVHWTAGVTFCEGSTMQLSVGNVPAGTNWHVNWSGYLIPPSLGVVESEPREQLGLDIVPNPTTSGARIGFDLASRSIVVLGIFDVQGRRVRTVYAGDLAAGPHALDWDGRTDDGQMARNGVYVAQLETPTELRREKLTRVN